MSELSVDKGYYLSQLFILSRLTRCRACRPRHRHAQPISYPYTRGPTASLWSRAWPFCSDKRAPQTCIWRPKDANTPVTFVSDSRPSRNVNIYDTNTYECHTGNVWQAVRFVRACEAPKHISLVVSETYIMSDHNNRTGLFLDTLHPSDKVTFLKS